MYLICNSVLSQSVDTSNLSESIFLPYLTAFVSYPIECCYIPQWCVSVMTPTRHGCGRPCNGSYRRSSCTSLNLIFETEIPEPTFDKVLLGFVLCFLSSCILYQLSFSTVFVILFYVGIHFNCHTYVSDLHNQLQMNWRFRKLCQNAHYITCLLLVGTSARHILDSNPPTFLCIQHNRFRCTQHNYTAYCLYTPGKRHWRQTLGRQQGI